MSEEKEKSLLPAPIEEFSVGNFKIENFEDIKKALTVALKKYDAIEVTDEFYVEAKNTRAELNKVSQALDTRRKELKKRYMEPFEIGEKQINELVAMVKEASGKIDAGIKAVEDKRRTDKLNSIKELFATIDNPYGVELEKIWTESWLNAGTSLKKISEEITSFLEKVDDDIKTITESIFSDNPKRANEAKKFYLENGYDLKAALAKERELYDYTHRSAPAPVEVPTQAHETPSDMKIISINFRVYGTEEELVALGNYIKEHHLKFETLGH